MRKQVKKKVKKQHSRKNLWCIILALMLSVGGCVLAFPPQERINQGLDIRGGMSLVLAANPQDGQEITSEIMDNAKNIIESRVNALGASEASVQVMSNSQILVQIPGMSDSTAALETIGKTGVLEFARLDSFTDEDIKSKIESRNIIDTTSVKTPKGEAPTGGSNLVDYSKAKHIKVEPGTYDVIFTGAHIDNVTVGRESDASSAYAVNIRLDGEATSAFADATRELYASKGKIVIILDGEVNSAPAVQSMISNGEVAITGGYSLEDAKSLQTVLDSGSLPVSFTYEQSQTVGPTLGQGEFQAGVLSMLFGLIVVILYLLVFYRGLGLVPALSMCVFATIYLGVLAGLSRMGLFSLSLAGIAGAILSIGMAADAAILTIERFKEELKEGKTLKVASTSGVKHAMITSIDANIVSILSAAALFFLASSTVKGFGLTLSLGIVCNIIVILLFIGPIMRLIGPKVLCNHSGFFGVKYSIELGDLRAGNTNYLTPAEIKEMKKQERETAKIKKEKEKEKAKIRKEHDKETDKRVKEIRKETKQQERQKKADIKTYKREMRKRIKAEDAEIDAERKAKKKEERTEKKTNKQDNKKEKERVQLSTVEEENARKKKSNFGEAEVIDVEETTEKEFVGVLKPDENEKVRHVSVKENIEIDAEAMKEAFAKIGENDITELSKKEDSEEKNDEKASKFSKEKISGIIDNVGEYIPDDDGLEREVNNDIVMTHEVNETSYNQVPKEQNKRSGQPPQAMNRAQRRQAARKANKKKNQ